MTSPYIAYIALLVICYGMSINLIEAVWKKQVALHCNKNFNAMTAFMGTWSQLTGVTAIVMIMVTKGIIRRFGWFVGAVVTPMMLAITGGLFFLLLLGQDSFSPFLSTMSVSVVAAAAYLGMAQSVLSKATKYALFDPTKEMAYIPLDPELKTKGKAAVEVVGGRLGKAGGGVVTVTLLSVFGDGKDIMQLILPIAAIVALTFVLWFWGVKKLSFLYNQLTGEK